MHAISYNVASISPATRDEKEGAVSEFVDRLFGPKNAVALIMGCSAGVGLAQARGVNAAGACTASSRPHYCRRAEATMATPASIALEMVIAERRRLASTTAQKAKAVAKTPT